MMFNYVDNKENYISFMDDNYLDSYGNPSNSYTAEEIATIVSTIPDEHWFTFDKMKVYVNGAIEVIHLTTRGSQYLGEVGNVSSVTMKSSGTGYSASDTITISIIIINS